MTKWDSQYRMFHRCKKFAKTVVLLGPVLLFCIAASWTERNSATGDWGFRSRLEQKYGLHIELDYTAETFDTHGDYDASYRGNADLILTIDTSKSHLWHNGLLLIYGEHAHGHGISNQLDLIMPVSNLEAQPFTQLSEFWLLQQIGARFHLRVGKQDTNRDFGNPRFPGNFVNSSFGALPGIPMPSFPAPGLGAAVFYDATKWLQLRSGIFQGTPRIGSFIDHVFDNTSGTFSIAGVAVNQSLRGHQAIIYQFGAWDQTSMNQSGLFGLFDMFMPLKSDRHPNRSLQLFIRGDWSTNNSTSKEEIIHYVGGGITAHSFLGKNNTAGFGFGFADTEIAREKFVEMFYKIREIAWLTFEPDVQLYSTARTEHVIFGLRTKLKI